MPAKTYLIGQKFQRLTVIEEAPSLRLPCGRLSHRSLCLCECGNKVEVDNYCLKKGATGSCGCLRKELASAKFTTHGHSLEYTRSSTYQTWANLIQRCTNPVHTRFKYYGGRGITVCERWRAFESFLADMGERPEGTSIDRIDNSRGYEPGNCRWATRVQQMRNTRTNHIVTVLGITGCMAEVCEHFGMPYHTVKDRINKLGWTIEDAMTRPTRDH